MSAGVSASDAISPVRSPSRQACTRAPNHPSDRDDVTTRVPAPGRLVHAWLGRHPGCAIPTDGVDVPLGRVLAGGGEQDVLIDVEDLGDVQQSESANNAQFGVRIVREVEHDRSCLNQFKNLF